MRGGDREGRNMKKTKWRQRLRGITKWGGVTLCVLLFALWLVSGWYCGEVQRVRSVTTPTGGTSPVADRTLRIDSGVLIVQYFADDAGKGPQREWRFTCQRSVDQFTKAPAPVRWSWWLWFKKVDLWGMMMVLIPLWHPFLLIALPTGWLFWSDHRRRNRGGAGCCEKCGYALTGNTTGRCPECGEDSVVVKKS